MPILTQHRHQEHPPRTAAPGVLPSCADPPGQPPAEALGPEAEERVGGIARAVAQGAVEVLDGSRPAQQMSRWLDPASYEKLHLRACLLQKVAASEASGPCPGGTLVDRRAYRCVTVRSARLCRVSATAFEAALVVLDRRRARAVALRVEHRRGDWKVTALEIG
ncbi:hypothetical protein E2F48_16420 [Arthrobacter crusticola]|uniref:Uncharacterized protein n=1 Tax=Arthrobacter crusticola TaxID=2547960 RepID=A0A4R5TMG6_9MICC|nr:Rv3235 family protein [Arthrobacter crusticola]TDK23569.1 hypothetical protein E2F48_16420 [Arthrobacter crusticola]